jgi:hypothetical protein
MFDVNDMSIARVGYQGDCFGSRTSQLRTVSFLIRW